MCQPDTTAPDGPVATALAGLCAFLSGAVGDGVAVAVAVPVGPPGDLPRLCVWPTTLLPDQGTRGGYGLRRLRLRCRHVVTADGPVHAAVALLDRVLVALAGQDRYQLVLRPVPAGSLAVDAALRPAAVLIDVPAQIAVTPPPAPRVIAGLRVDGGVVRPLEGRVVGPGGVPLAGMAVTSPSSGATVVTDHRGGFVLTGQPAAGAVLLHLSGHGLHLRAEVSAEATEPVVIHCPIEEV